MDTSSVSRRSGWVSLCVTAAARAVLVALASLALWAVAPAALGLHPTVVMTGSMLPRLVPGDIVLSRPVPASQLQLDQTLLFPDPDQPGHLRLHRWVDVDPDGRLVTKGDANASNDSTTIARTDVTGVASLRVPWIGRPVVWVNEGRTGSLALAAVGLIVVVAAAFWYRREDDELPPAEDETDATEEPTDEATAARWPRRLAHSGAALLVVVGLGSTYATSADAATAKFTRQTVAPSNSWNASTFFSCGGAARSLQARFAWPLGESNGTTANDVTTNGLDGTYSLTGVTYRVAGPCATDGTSAVTLNGSTGNVSVNASATNIADLTLQVWFKSTTTGRGGVLMSLTSGTTSTMALGMTTTGAISFAVNTGTIRRVTSTPTFRDNAWHLATGVAGTNGMTLYVDGVALGTNTAVTSTTAVTGTPRVGYGDASDLSVATYDYYQGSVAYASLYKDTLSAAEVLASYRAAS